MVAAFDFDGTLTDGGSVWRFLVATVGVRRVLTAAGLLVVKLALAAAFGDGAADSAKEALFKRTLRGLGEKELAAKAQRFGLEHYLRHARADVRARLEWHRGRGHKLVIVSASPDLYVSAVGKELDVDEVVATKLEVGPDGLLTGGYDGKNCRGEQKLERLEHWVTTSLLSRRSGDAANVASAPDAAEKPYLWAYGNSAGDRALLEAADVGIDAGRLGRFGKLHKFTRLANADRDEAVARS